MNQPKHDDSLQRPREGKDISLCSKTVKSAATTISAKRFRIGVSLKNVLTSEETTGDERRWYVLRATYGREVEVYEKLQDSGLIVYLAMRYVKPYRNAPKHKWELKPLINNILFVYSTMDDVKPYVRNVNSAEAIPYLHFYYDHTLGREGGTESVAEIPMPQMRNFIRLTSIASKDTMCLSPEEYHCSRLNPGQKVMVSMGEFRGVVGEVIRYRRQTTVAVEMPLLGAFTTAYIPKDCLIPVPKGIDTSKLQEKHHTKIKRFNKRRRHGKSMSHK